MNKNKFYSFQYLVFHFEVKLKISTIAEKLAAVPTRNAEIMESLLAITEGRSFVILSFGISNYLW